jgi:hypothetical protein
MKTTTDQDDSVYVYRKLTPAEVCDMLDRIRFSYLLTEKEDKQMYDLQDRLGFLDYSVYKKLTAVEVCDLLDMIRFSQLLTEKEDQQMYDIQDRLGFFD